MYKTHLHYQERNIETPYKLHIEVLSMQSIFQLNFQLEILPIVIFKIEQVINTLNKKYL